MAAGTGFTRTGYNFAGWSDGSQVLTASTSYQMPVVNTQLTAQWTVALPNTPAAPTAVAGDGSAVVTVTPGMFLADNNTLSLFSFNTNATLPLIAKLFNTSVIPFVLITYVRAITTNFELHKKIAKYTFPLWLYVTISGVLVYYLISPYYS